MAAHGAPGARIPCWTMPDLLKSLGIDVFALTDSDTDEARTFTTYAGYWSALGQHIEEEYGAYPYPRLLLELESRGLSRLASKPASCDEKPLRELLLNAWSSELALHSVNLDDAKRLWLENQWAQVKAYYAASRVAGAWLLARDGNVPDNHSGLLRAIAAQVSGTRLYPAPWSLCCSALRPAPAYRGFPCEPSTGFSNLAANVNRHDRTAMMLRTTRERDVERQVDVVKRQRRTRRSPNGEYARQDASLAPTTVFDFAWRMRTRSNYGDPAMFYVGTLSPERAQDYALAIRAFTGATMFLFEALVAQKARRLVAETAVHFISRDRAQIADQVLAPRLRGLELL
jgi:hypothetical protein